MSSVLGGNGGLFQLARRFGEASSLLSVQGSLKGLQELSPEFQGLHQSGLLSHDQFHELRELLTNGTKPHFPPRDDVDLPATIEGQILGQLIQEGTLPSEERGRFEALLKGEGMISREGVWEADRSIRAPWIVAFLRGRGIQPIGIPHHVRRTRIERFAPLEEIMGREVYLKREDDQPVGSFKIRGATNFLRVALLAGLDPQTVTIGTASHGNHALGVVQAAHNLGFRNVEALLPRTASSRKVAEVKALGAKVELYGETIEDCAVEAMRRAKANPNYLFLPAFDHPLVVIGQGTFALEVSLQMSIQGHEDFALALPTGGGGLIAGSALYLNSDASPQKIAVFGVESKAHPYVSRSFHLKKIVEPEEIRYIETVADGIALLKIGEAGFQSILNFVREVEVVPERLIEATIAFLAKKNIVLEGAAATPIATFLFGGLSLERHDVPANVPLVIGATGKNIDPILLSRIVAEYGEGRWRQLRDEFLRLKTDLENAGWMKDGAVRILKTAEEGIAFYDFLVSRLPVGWDSLDALELLDFGTWQEKKDINATFRSYGQYHQRWNHSKEEALTHPESNRGQILETVLQRLEKGMSRKDALDRFSLVDLRRLQVETHVMGDFLKHPSWLARLRPDLASVDRALHFSQFQAQNDLLKDSIRRFREKMNGL